MSGPRGESPSAASVPSRYGFLVDELALAAGVGNRDARVHASSTPGRSGPRPADPVRSFRPHLASRSPQGRPVSVQHQPACLAGGRAAHHQSQPPESTPPCPPSNSMRCASLVACVRQAACLSQNRRIVAVPHGSCSRCCVNRGSLGGRTAVRGGHRDLPFASGQTVWPSCSRERTCATLRSMDAQWVGVALTAIAVVVSLAVFIRSGSTQLRGEFRSEMQSFRQEQREEVRALAAQQREDHRELSDKLTALAARQREDHRELSDKLTALAERTTRIEEALVPRSTPILRTAAQSLPPTE